ncbi:hypothetical protein BHE74_00052418, partial [Ensete ventricosum]
QSIPRHFHCYRSSSSPSSSPPLHHPAPRTAAGQPSAAHSQRPPFPATALVSSSSRHPPSSSPATVAGYHLPFSSFAAQPPLPSLLPFPSSSSVGTLICCLRIQRCRFCSLQRCPIASSSIAATSRCHLLICRRSALGSARPLSLLPSSPLSSAIPLLPPLLLSPTTIFLSLPALPSRPCHPCCLFPPLHRPKPSAATCGSSIVVSAPSNAARHLLLKCCHQPLPSPHLPPASPRQRTTLVVAAFLSSLTCRRPPLFLTCFPLPLPPSSRSLLGRSPAISLLLPTACCRCHLCRPFFLLTLLLPSTRSPRRSPRRCHTATATPASTVAAPSSAAAAPNRCHLLICRRPTLDSVLSLPLLPSSPPSSAAGHFSSSPASRCRNLVPAAAFLAAAPAISLLLPIAYCRCDLCRLFFLPTLLLPSAHSPHRSPRHCHPCINHNRTQPLPSPHLSLTSPRQRTTLAAVAFLSSLIYRRPPLFLPCHSRCPCLPLLPSSSSIAASPATQSRRCATVTFSTAIFLSSSIATSTASATAVALLQHRSPICCCIVALGHALLCH